MKQVSIKEHDGFTLIEIMIVVIIIGILASLAMPRYQKTVERSRISEALSILGSIRTAQYRYASEHNRFTNSLDNLDMNVTSGKYFSFGAANSSTPFDVGSGSNGMLANATRNSLQGGLYGDCSLYTIGIYESGNFSASGTGSCAELSAILN